MKHSPGFLRLTEAAKQKTTEIAVADVMAKQAKGESFAFIDVREDDEWRAGHAKGARHLGRGVIERDIESQLPDSSTPLVLYCGGGYRSALAAESLQKMGYTNVLSMAGGYRAWQDAGGEIEK